MKGITNKDLDSIKKILNDSENILIISHRNPDGDAVGSLLGLFGILLNMNKKIKAITPNDFPNFLKWLPNSDKIVIYDNNIRIAQEIINSSDLIFFLDFNELSRIAGLEKVINESKSKKILIDHHPYPSDFCDYIISTTDVSSTAELVFEFINEIGLENYIDKSIASALLTGIMTDTVLFNVNSFRASTFDTTSKIISYGVEFDNIRDQIFSSYSESRMRLLGFSLSNKMKLITELKTAYITISKKEIFKYNFKKGDSEGFVNYPLSISGVDISVLFIEKKDHVKISFRSKGIIPINEYAREFFNGGGHRNAAGGESYDTLKNTISKFKKTLPAFFYKINE